MEIEGGSNGFQTWKVQYSMQGQTVDPLIWRAMTNARHILALGAAVVSDEYWGERRKAYIAHKFQVLSAGVMEHSNMRLNAYYVFVLKPGLQHFRFSALQERIREVLRRRKRGSVTTPNVRRKLDCIASLYLRSASYVPIEDG